MKSLASRLLMITIALLTGCDPGIKIGQAKSTSNAITTACAVPPEITVAVKTDDRFIGSRWYYPEVTVTNLSDALITITRIEMVVQGATYENKPPWKEDNRPAAVPVGAMRSFEAAFHFNEGVGEIFSKPEELRIHYSTQGHNEIACTILMRE